MYVPDNYDAWKAHEARLDRQEVIEKKREYDNELEFTTVPQDYGQHEDCYPDRKD